MLTLVVAMAGLVIGTLAWPTVAKHYYLGRLEHGDPVERLKAMNRLAGRAVGDGRLAETLLGALMEEGLGGEPGRQRGVEMVAVWVLERLTGAAPFVDAMLDESEAERFALLAGWLEAAGRWNLDRRSQGQLVRREIYRLGHDDEGVRLGALEALQGIGLCEQDILGPMLRRSLGASGRAERKAAVWTAAVCLPEAREVLTAALDDEAGEVRRAATIGLAWLGRDVLERRVEAGGLAVDATLLWCLRGTLAGSDLARDVLRDGESSGRRMAAWVLGFAAPGEVGVTGLLTNLLGDDDPVVAGRSAIALGRRGAVLEDSAGLIRMTESGTADLRLAGVYALGRCAVGSGDSVDGHLRQVLEGALKGGDLATAGAAVESLGRVGGQGHGPLLLDVVDRFVDEPMLAYLAACAAVRLDEKAGVDGLMELCGSTHDGVRELAAWRLSRMDRPPLERLRTGLIEGGDPLRGGAALGLALCGVCELAEGDPLVGWLVRRFDTGDAAFEPSWQIRANYLAARLLCGDGTARADLDVYWLNRNVSRMGLYISLLQQGDLLPMAALLGSEPMVDVASFLRDGGFGEVLGCYLPGAPRFEWVEDAAIRRYQVERLGEWWRIFRHRLRFDGQRQVFVLR